MRTTIIESKKLSGGTTVDEILDIPTAETDTNLVLKPNGTGGVEWAEGGGGLEKRHEWDIPYDYCFTAPLGSLETDAVWTGNRITTNSIGEATTETLYNVKWSERTIIF